MIKKRPIAYTAMPIETSTMTSSASHVSSEPYGSKIQLLPNNQQTKPIKTTRLESPKKRDKSYLFKCLLLANFLQYLEAGAVPALLLQLSESFEMKSGQQGLLGGVVYLSLSLGGPFAGYLLRHYEHKTVICTAVAVNMFFTLIWAMTPVGEIYSTHMFIAVRFIMGLCQCIVCVFLPLWTNENAPKQSRTKWMSYLQASVPFGIMMGYIIASVITTVFRHATVCMDLLCWRWPFLIEVMLLSPLYLGLYFIPREDIAVMVNRPSKSKRRHRTSRNELNIITESSDGDDVFSSTTNEQTSIEMIDRSKENGSNVMNKNNQRGNDGDFNEKSLLMRSEKDSGTYYDALNDSPTHSPQRGRNSSQYHRPRVLTDDEQQRRHSLRQQSMSASMWGDPMSTINVIKSSCDDMTLLEKDEDMFHSLTNYHWSTGSNSGREYSPYDLSSGYPSQNSIANQQDAFDTAAAGRGPLNNDGAHRGSMVYGSAPGIYGDQADLQSVVITPRKNNAWFWGGLSLQYWNSSTSGEYSTVDGDSKQQQEIRSNPGIKNPLHAADKTEGCTAGDLEVGGISNNSSLQKQAVTSTVNRRTTKHSVHSGSSYESFRDLNKRESNSSWGGLFGSWSGSNRSQVASDSGVDNGRFSIGSNCGSEMASNVSKPQNGISSHQQSSELQQDDAQLLNTDVERSSDGSPFSSDPSNSRSASALQSASGRGTPSTPQLSGGVTDSCSRVHTMPSIQSEDSNDDRVKSEDNLHPPRKVQVKSPDRCSDEGSHEHSDSESDEEWESLPAVSRTNSAHFDKRSDVDSDAAISGFEQYNLDGEIGAVSCTRRVVTTAYRQSRSVMQSVMALLSISTYRYLLGAMTALYFTVTGVQFWGTKYLSVALNAPLPLVNSLFILCAATGPTLGVFFGGWIVDKCGGYKGAHQRVVALEICGTFGVLGAFFSVPVTFFSNIFVAVSFLWLVLFFGGSMLPACSGIIVSIIPRDYRPTSSSLSLVVFNMFGYFMSLVLSGFLMQILEEFDDSVCNEVCAMTWGFRLVLFWSFLSLCFLISALLSSYQNVKDRERGRTSRLRQNSGSGSSREREDSLVTTDIGKSTTH